MTELDYLLDLILNHKLEKRTKISIKERIAMIQVQVPTISGNRYQAPANIGIPINGVSQSPSMAAKIAEFESERERGNVPQETPAPMSPAAAKALAERQRVIQQALSGAEEKGRTSPRKF